MKRRKFIFSLAGAAAAGLAACKPASSSESGALPLDSRLAKVTRRSHALGTDVNLTVYHREQAAAEAAIDRALAELDRVEQVMSLYRPQSELCRLNATGRLHDASPALVQVLAEAQALSARSEGVFDVTVQPLWEVFSVASEQGKLPTSAEIAAAQAKVDWRRVNVSGSSVSLDGAGTAVTLNGIAQGYASDVVKRVLEEAGVAHALIDTGEIGTLGQHVRKDCWSIGIKHPRHPGELLGVAGLKGRSLATSGDYETTFDADFRHHHLIDPHTGDSPTELSSVSVVALTGLQADGLSTAVFLLGLEKGRALIEATPGADALFVTKSGGIEQTNGFPFLG